MEIEKSISFKVAYTIRWEKSNLCSSLQNIILPSTAL
jgi:hypothetical protein